MNNNWDSGSWRPPSDNTSYFNNINAAREREIRAEIAAQIKNEAEKVIHSIVIQKDSEIDKLKKQNEELKDKIQLAKEQSEERYKTRIENQQKEIETLKREKRHFSIPEEPEFIPEDVEEYFEATVDEFAETVLNIFKYGKSAKGFKQANLEKIRKIVLCWKRFLEEYKWKSNYISVKIKKLLLDTEQILNENDPARDI